MLVYKYVVPERIDVLKNGYIRFSPVDALNDPFEIYPRVDEFKKVIKSFYRKKLKESNPNTYFIERESIIHKAVESGISNLVKKFRTDYILLCLTRKRNNLVMWSHYTYSHHGFVIGLDSTNQFFHQKELGMLNKLIDVKYTNTRASFPSLTQFIEDDFGNLVENFEKCLFTKSIHWAYEEELRILSQPDYGKIIGKDNNGLDIYVFDFPPECLKEIIFGYLSTTELKRRISEIVASRYPHVELFEAQPSETDFDLDIKSYRVP